MRTAVEHSNIHSFEFFFFLFGCPCIELFRYHPNFLKQLPAILWPNVSLMLQCIAFSKDKCEANGKIPPAILCKVCFPPLICFDVFGLVLLFLTLHLGDISLISSRERRLSRR